MPLSDIGTADDYELTPAPNGPLSRYTYQPPMNAQDVTAQGGIGTLSASNPSWSDRLGAGFANSMDWLRGSSSRQGWQNASDISQNVAGLVPGLGQALSANQGYRSAQEGNVPGAVIGALGAVPIPGARAEVGAAEDIARTMPHGGPMSGGGILAYHGGAPNIDKFDSKFFESGTGALNQGAGLYTSTDPEVVEQYRLPMSTIRDPKGNIIDPNENRLSTEDFLAGKKIPPQQAALDAMAYGRDWEGAAHRIMNLGEDEPNVLNDQRKSALDALQQMKDSGHTITDEPTAYQLKINEDPNNFLDHHIAIKDQSPYVQDAVGKLPIKVNPKWSGDQVYSKLEQHHDWDTTAATKSLQDAGIPGVRYIDEWHSPDELASDLIRKHGSIEAAAAKVNDPSFKMKSYDADDIDSARDWFNNSPKTQNYVVFNPRTVDILKKFSVAGGGLVGAMAAAHKAGVDTGEYQASPMSD